MRIFLFLFLVIYFGGCALFNPFTPPSGSVISVDQSCPLPPQEPITSSAMYHSTMKPYCVKGVRYEPIVPNIGDTFKGVASWYGPNFHGGKTSNGEYYDMTALTAAHKTLPMNTQVKVTNLDNGRSTIVRINDRGPFVSNRIIDLSYEAAKEIGMIKKGTANVKLEIVDYDTMVDRYKKYKPFPLATDKIEKIKTLPKSTQKIEPLTKTEITNTTITNTQKSPQKRAKLKSAFPQYEVQLLSSKKEQKAKLYLQKYATMLKTHNVHMKKSNINGQYLYEVVVGGFHSKKQAYAFIINNGLKGALVKKD